ncbi:hypothetical protein [Nostoc sp. FACHB-110]|uniref:hypothetical protein n=1 Tax=Nostoc sp. FACHB-110 TaxID=2692834 RepID=UPI00168391E8|nr:hypothetical protein [Nostoc sp. FACHB-110]MBD2435818.1 hypothetical protein [Nostoc sp. FACHB-110]
MNQKTLDRLTAIFGSVAVASTTLGGAGVIGSTWAQTIAAVSSALTVVLARMPATPQQPQPPK